MFKKMLLGGLVAMVVFAGVLAGSAGTANAAAADGRGTGSGTAQTAVAVTPLTQVEKDALVRAIQEEYLARDLYQSIINTFGNVTPFSRIVKSEQQHVSALITQATKYGVPVPSPAANTFPIFASLSAACQAGVDAEIADAALYDELKPVTTHADILQVYTRLQSASLNSHLPAFEVCR